MSDVPEPVPDPEPAAIATPGGPVPAGYPAFLADLKERVRAAQLRGTLSVNHELLRLHWQLGRGLSAAFPGVAGFSARNLWRIRALARAYPEVLPPAVAEIP